MTWRPSVTRRALFCYPAAIIVSSRHRQAWIGVEWAAGSNRQRLSSAPRLRRVLRRMRAPPRPLRARTREGKSTPATEPATERSATPRARMPRTRSAPASGTARATSTATSASSAAVGTSRTGPRAKNLPRLAPSAAIGRANIPKWVNITGFVEYPTKPVL